MKEIAKEPWNYVFSEDASGHYILTVVCGGVGVYEVTIRLNASQSESYKSDGLAYVAGLAEQVRHDQAPFEAQKI
jgi:hypothetical protein